MDQRNGSAVGVADQQRPLDFELVEQPRQSIERFLVHEGRRPRASQPVGFAIAETRIHQGRSAQAARNLVRKIAPKPYRAQSFVQEYQGRARSGAAENRAVFDAAAVDGDKGHGWLAVDKNGA